MASVHQHQVESRVNDLYLKMQRHAQIIMRLSVELDNIKTENADLKLTIINNRKAIKNLIKNSNNKVSNDDSQSVLSNNFHENYENYDNNSEMMDNKLNEEQFNDIKLSSN